MKANTYLSSYHIRLTLKRSSYGEQARSDKGKNSGI